jgi:hypothetical protein
MEFCFPYVDYEGGAVDMTFFERLSPQQTLGRAFWSITIEGRTENGSTCADLVEFSTDLPQLFFLQNATNIANEITCPSSTEDCVVPSMKFTLDTGVDFTERNIFHGKIIFAPGFITRDLQIAGNEDPLNSSKGIYQAEGGPLTSGVTPVLGIGGLSETPIFKNGFEQ